jgi:hypothetical protein
MSFVSEYEINNFRHRSVFIRSAVNVKDRNRFGKFEKTEPRTFGIVSVNKLSGGTTVY